MIIPYKNPLILSLFMLHYYYLFSTLLNHVERKYLSIFLLLFHITINLLSCNNDVRFVTEQFARGERGRGQNVSPTNQRLFMQMSGSRPSMWWRAVWCRGVERSGADWERFLPVCFSVYEALDGWLTTQKNTPVPALIHMIALWMR